MKNEMDWVEKLSAILIILYAIVAVLALILGIFLAFKNWG